MFSKCVVSTFGILGTELGGSGKEDRLVSKRKAERKGKGNVGPGGKTQNPEWGC